LVDVDITQPDFLKIAEAYGIRGIRVTNQEDVDSAIQEAEADPGPVIIDFRVAQQDNVWPMVPAGAALSETVESSSQI
jgi:acetolactate synthase-1/2/3 large subunit